MELALNCKGSASHWRVKLFPGGKFIAGFAAKSAIMMRVAVKFCGGCDPAYERLEYLEKIQSAAGNRIRWVLIEDSEFEAILLISGCQKACPGEQLPCSIPIVSLKSDEADPQLVVDMLIERGAKR